MTHPTSKTNKTPKRTARKGDEGGWNGRMARKIKGLPVNGWVLLDKPLGITSTQAVGRVRRLFNARKAGHGGTLDPLASGVLPIASIIDAASGGAFISGYLVRLQNMTLIHTARHYS